jgi:hypothetical protein
MKNVLILTALLLTSTLSAKIEVNHKPIAVAKVDKKMHIIKTFKSKLIKFSAEDSQDSFGKKRNLRYEWIAKDKHVLSHKKMFVHKFDKKGVYSITLKITDRYNQTAIDKVSILVDMDEVEVANMGHNAPYSSI